jgi:hypothetical protein
MTVEELIKVLQQHDPKAEAVVSGYEGGYKEVKFVETLELVPDFYNQHWMGPYENLDTVKYLYNKTPDTTVSGVVLL